MNILLFPPHHSPASLERVAVRAAWWLGTPPGAPAAPVVFARTAPLLDVRSIEPRGPLDERIALRLTRLNAMVEPVASVAAHARTLLERALQGDTVLVTDRSALPADIAGPLRATGRLLEADAERDGDEALAWLSASAAVPFELPSQGWAVLRRATADTGRIVVVGREVAEADAARLGAEVVALDPALAATWPGESTMLTVLDDPIRHLGPSATAAILRNAVLSRLERTRTMFLCAPAAAARLVASRVPRSLWDRVLLVDVPPRRDPGPATLLAAVGAVVDTVAVIGWSGRAASLAPDERALHPAAATLPPAPADLAPLLAGLEATGTHVRALGRTAHPGLRERDGGRAPTAVDDPDGLLGDAVARFDPAGARRMRVRRHTVADAPAVMVEAGADTLAVLDGDVAGHDLADAVLQAADAADPALVLGAAAPQAVSPGPSALATLRARLGPGEGPAGPFAGDDDELAALVRHRRLVDRDLDRAMAPRLARLAPAWTGRVFLFGAGFDWSTINGARLRGASAVFVNTRVDVLSRAMVDELARGLLVTTEPELREGDGPAPSHVVRLTALAAAHRGPDDIVFDPAVFLPPGRAGADAVAVQLVRALGARPIVLLGVASDAVPFADDLAILADARSAGAEGAAFHDLFRDEDWAGAARVLLAMGEDAPVATLERLLAGLGDRLAVLVEGDGRARLAVGGPLRASVRDAAPAYGWEDAALGRALARFGPALVLAWGSARVPAVLTGTPLMRIGPGADAPALRLPEPDTAGIAQRAALPPDAAVDRARLAIARRLGEASASPRRRRGRAPAGADSRAEAPAREGQGGLGRLGPALAAAGPLFRRARLDMGRGGAVAPIPSFPETTMSDETQGRTAGFAALWPWPGTVLFALFAAWLFYMARLTEAADLRAAFQGLGGVAVVIVLLGLRKAIIRSPEERAPHRRRRDRVAEPMPRAGSRRSAIPDAAVVDVEAEPVEAEPRRVIAAEPLETAGSGGAGGGGGMPINARVRARMTEVAATEPPARATLPKASDPDFPPAGASLGRGRGGRSDAAEELRQLEAKLNRERAERGAQIAKAEASLGGRLDEMGGRLDELGGRLDGVAATVTGLEQRVGQPDEEKAQGLTMAAFNTAVNRQLLPRLQKLVEERLAAATDGEALRAKLGPVAGGPAPEIAERLAATQAALGELNASARDERAAVREEIAHLKRLQEEQRAALDGLRLGAGPADADAAGMLRDLRGRLDALEAGGAGGARLEEALRAMEELRGNLSAVTQHVARMGEHYRDLLQRIDRIGEHMSPAAPAPAATVQSEVEALRDALTTIIEQNREIRAQQEMLTARFDQPTRVEVDTSR